MSARGASRRDHRRFCTVEGWREVRNARGKRVGHHLTYELELPDARVLRTRISRPANAEVYGPRLWSHILDVQLEVDEEAFWACVDDRRSPVREPSPLPADRPLLPASLAHQLVHTLRLPSEVIAELSVEEAVRLMADHWASADD